MVEPRQLSVLEKKLLISFLKDLNKTFGNAGCNDYRLPNDPAHQKLMKRVIKAEFESEEQQNQLEYLIESDKQILTMDTTVLSYIMSCVERLPTQTDEGADLP